MGVQNEPFLPAKQWQAQISYQYGDANDFFVGDQRDDAAAGGPPPHRVVSLLNLDVLYGVTNRFSLDLTVPFAVGSAVVGSSEFKASGLGDVSLQAEYWLSNPAMPSRVTGSVGLGLKAPTGADDVQATGEDGPFPADESAQLGTGGWELLLRAQGTAQIAGPLFAYASGYYGLSLEENNGVENVHDPGTLRGTPDTFSGRLGAAYVLPVLDEGLVLSLGGRINGVTVKDLIGGGDLHWRRPGYVIYVEPGLTWTLGRNMASLSVPVRTYAKKIDSLLDVSLDRSMGASFASYLFLASYSRRF